VDLSGAVLLDRQPQPRQRPRLLRRAEPPVIGYRRDGRPIYAVLGESNTTNTYTEVINGIPVAGTALNDTATGAVISTAAQAGILPVGFFNQYCVNKAIQFFGFGVISTSASGPATLAFGVGANTTLGTYAPAVALATQTAVAPAVSLSSVIWEVNGWSTVQSLSGQSPQMVTFGTVTIGGAGGAAGVAYTFGSATPVSLTTGMNLEYGIELTAKWGTAVSGCTLTCEQWIVQGMN
jgi:hypothetical protein